MIEGDSYTIDLLNLNDYGLRRAREAVIKKLHLLEKDDIVNIYMNEDAEQYAAYYNVIKWYLNSL